MESGDTGERGVVLFRHLRSLAAGPFWLLGARYLIQAQPYCLLSGPKSAPRLKKWQAMTGPKLFVETGAFWANHAISRNQCSVVEL